MAESMPICDVLSEAMEYLSKLGTNIRIRSENLKDKRIRRDKLRNTHAVHKAVQKVLLICDLSKKSIENVETGVKNILLQIENSGSSYGSGPKTRERSDSNVKFEHFTYESRKLKIRDKISVEHYTSVKVVSTSMTLSMLEKYPVYHDCLLYRLREKNDKLKPVQNDCDSSGNEEVDTFRSKSPTKTDLNCEDIQSLATSIHSGGDSTNIEIEPIIGKAEIELKKCEYDSKSKQSSTSHEKLINIEEDNDDSETETMHREKIDKHKSKNFKHLKVIEDSSSSDREVVDQNNLLIETEHIEKINKQKSKKFKHLKVIEDSSSSDREVDDKKNAETLSQDNQLPSNSDADREESCINKEKHDENTKLSDVGTSKPLIKCVSLSKLLKPDRIKSMDIGINIESDKSNKKEKSRRKERISNISKSEKRIETKPKHTRDDIFKSSDEDDIAFWTHKRKEVKKFKPKKFNINITKLPNLTQDFLNHHKLDRITLNGSVLCERISHVDRDASDEKNNELESKSKRMKFSNTSQDKPISVDEVSSKVKSSLLIDSSSDDDRTCQNKENNLEKTNSKNITQASDSFDNHHNQSSLSKNKDCNSELGIENEKYITDNKMETHVINKEIETKIENSHEERDTLETQKNQDDSSCPGKEDKVRKFGKRHKGKSKKNIARNGPLDDSDSEIHNSDKISPNESDPEKMQNPSASKKAFEEPDSELSNEKRVSGCKAKNTLLNDSDSQNQEKAQTEKLHDSADKCSTPPPEDPNDSINLYYPSDCETELKDTEMVKSHLLKDSSDDLTKTPKKRKSRSGDSPPQSKRKHIMESMYAKKMLLTYSSSSDTEDEKLRNTLKEIKDSLLKVISSDESDKEKNGEESGIKESSFESETSDDLTQKSVTAPIKKESDTDTQDTSGNGCGSISRKSKMGRSLATGDSCSQNSDIRDAHDKEIEGLTNLKTLKETYRRRGSTSTRPTRNSRSRRKMAKAGGLISSEGFLQAESSSDGASLSGSDHGDAADLEEMPRVKLSDLNGDDIGHLAKDDLLEESDTSVSHDEKMDEKKDDTDEENVKSKRRKAIAISSDSEAGSSRRKGRAVRLSDFEDSEDESSEPAKNKRKKKTVDSDASAGSSSEEGKKKRRRIKTLDESDVSGSDTENEGRNKHGRKNIRKVMGKNQLEEATKKAAREEKERIARITERQKLYNNLEFDESGKPDEVVLEKVVLDFDPETKEPLIEVDRGLVKKLKPHQANGIKFMWDACFESVKRIKKDKGSGCILAHCMGLGKTLQVVSLTHTLLTHSRLTAVNRVLVVCPLSTVLNWVNEFRIWLKHAEADFEVDVYELSKFKQNSERAFQLSQWFQHGGVCVLGYEMFRNLSAEKGKKFKKKMLKNFQESLVDPGPDLVVCDEGHLLKNEKTSLSQSMNRVKTLRRIVLTGTPLQNNLKEYYCMVQFVKPNLLGKYNEYLNRFVNPITNGQYTDSTEHDIRVMKRRSHVLHKMLDGAVQRRDYGVLAPFLPPKHEYVLFITLTEVQIKLYHHYLDNYSRRPQPGKSSGFLFPDFQSLQRIWTHPLVLKYNSERYEIMQQKKREREEEDSEGSLVDFIDDDSTPDESSSEESSDDMSDVSDDSRKKSKKKKSGKKGKNKDIKASARRGTRANPIDVDEEEPIESLVEVKNENPTEWWMKLMGEEELEDMRNSHKLVLLFDILRQCEAIGDKLLVFSQSLYSLDLIEHFLGKVDEATQEGRVDEKLGGHVGSWSPGIDYFRLDGSTSCENRSLGCKNFNREDNPRARLFLISTRAGGLGINLVAANRVVIFDVSWNPSHDVQSIFRVYRFGQKKPCYVYRFLAMGTMEEKIYERQVTKQAISKRVIDEQQIDRHYAENDLAELYKFEPQPPVPRPLPPLPKDRLFAEMLKEHEAQIYKYHEHDSLLENKEEETLSEEERRAAWEDFENEKTRPPPQPFVSPYAMHNGLVQGLLAQQQQQMAFAALTAMLRKDMPNMTDQQIRDMLPLICNSNPGMFGGYDYGLMQKMGDLYKYAQPGMMNPAMMNPMTAGSAMAGVGAMGGASGLQYEPPWQRQQQQQHQMRLQQLMQQQQNSMGAKYYAGGLGSRDPMAMALQQQRARELMHRPRPRGRPPLAGAAPRAPPPAPHAGDVVDLDSD